MQVHYEPHPVSQERKAELRAQGLTIIDARFKPAGEPEPEADDQGPIHGDGSGEALPPVSQEPRESPGVSGPAIEADKPKRGRPAKADPEPEAE